MRRLVVLLALVGCGSSGPAVERVDTLEQAELAVEQAVDEFVAAGRTAVAYRELASDMRAAVAIDPRVGAEVERRSISLALFPVQAHAERTVSEQTEALALTVWPTLIGEARADETTAQYLERMCREQEALACGTVVPEYRGQVIALRVAERGLARMTKAIETCDECDGDGWRDVRRGWESAARAAAAAFAEVESRMQLGAWPSAGSGASLAVPALEIEVAENDIAVDGYRYATSFRVDVLRDLKSRGELVFFMHRDAPTRRLTALLRDAHDAGLPTVAILSRDASGARRTITLSTTSAIANVEAPVHAYLARVEQTVALR